MLNHPKHRLFALILLAGLSSCRAPESGPAILPESITPTYPQEQGIPTIQATPTPWATQTPAPTGTAAGLDEGECRQSVGEVTTYEFAWQEETLTGRIYTPPCYSETGNRYPVLYLLHGAAETEGLWVDLGLYEIADELINSEEIPPLLIVTPREDTWVSLVDNPYADMLMSALIPWVDEEYLTLAERNYRAVGGVSRGGNWAIRLGLMHWGAFGSLAGHSAPLFYGDLNRLPGWLEDIPPGSLPRVYLDIAEGDKNLAESESLRDILEKEEISLEWHLYPGLHDGNYWSSHLAEYLRWYSAGWSDY